MDKCSLLVINLFMITVTLFPISRQFVYWLVVVIVTFG